MRAHQIMTRDVITVTPDTAITEAASKMRDNHVSGLPVVDGVGKLVGIVSDGDFLRRSEIGTQRKRSAASVVKVESADHPSDDQVVAFARRFFRLTAGRHAG
jgi:CBS domain-containing protein